MDRQIVTCSTCGKEVFLRDFDDYAYKLTFNSKTKYFCSHTCTEEARKKYEDKIFDSAMKYFNLAMRDTGRERVKLLEKIKGRYCELCQLGECDDCTFMKLIEENQKLADMSTNFGKGKEIWQLQK